MSAAWDTRVTVRGRYGTRCRAPVSRAAGAPPSSPLARTLPQLEHRQERLLGHLDPPHLLHPLLPLLLLLQQLALAGDVAAVALAGDVLAVRLDRLPGHDPRSDRGLNGDVVLLAGDLLP